MPSNNLIWGLILMCAWGCNSPKVPSTSTRISSSELYLHTTEGVFLYNQTPYTGVAVSSYPNGTLATETTYSEGKRHGSLKRWFRDGTLSFVAQYQQGKQHGVSESYWRNGQLRSRARFEHGIAEGVQEQWYSSGQLFKRTQLVHGQEQGLQQSWRENGALYNNYEARNGRTFGLKRASLCFQLDDEKIAYSD